jgi:intracellular multiplication protein IcmN
MVQSLKTIMMLLLIGFGGCQSHWKPSQQERNQSLPKSVRNVSDKQIIQQMRSLESQNVTVITLGQDYLISIPSAMLFANHSPRLTWSSYRLLNEIVTYLRNFRIVGMTVTSYTKPYRSQHRTGALAKARSMKVANYLWSQGVDSRLMTTDGVVVTCPYTYCRQKNGISMHSRIEITFRNEII